MKKSSLIYIIYSLIIIGITCYFAILIVEGYFLDIAIKIKRVFAGEFLKSAEQRSVENENMMAKSFIRKVNLSRPKLNYDVCMVVNSKGEAIRIKDYVCPSEKTNNIIRIIALGDSFTWGDGVKTNETWPNQLERKLNEFNSSKYEVLNFGMGGFNTEEEVRILKEYGLLYNPDIIILQFYDNDAKNTTRIREKAWVMYKEYKIGIRDLPEELKNFNLSDDDVRGWFLFITDTEETQNCLEREFKECWKNVETPLIELTNITKSLNIDLIVFAFERELEQANALEKLSKEHNFTFLDLKEDIYSMPEEEVRLPDSHLNERGYDIISDKLLENVIGLSSQN